MLYEMFGRAHCAFLRLGQDESGQGTIEYVGLMVLMATVLTAVVGLAAKGPGKDLGNTVVGEITNQIKAISK